MFKKFSLALIGSVMLFQGNAYAESYNRLLEGQRLLPGDQVTNVRGYTLQFQATDRNLVAYQPGTTAASGAYWSAAISGKGADYVFMQEDGNFVAYTNAGAVVWNSGSGNHPGSHPQMSINGDGKLLIIVSKPTINSIWETPAAPFIGGCSTGSSTLYPVCIGKLNLSIPACSSSDAADYAHSQGGSYGACH